MAKTFSMDTTVDPLSLLARGKRVAKQYSATLVGTEESGRFSHDMLKGEYRIMGETVIVTITEKHWLLPSPLLEAHLRELLR